MSVKNISSAILGVGVDDTTIDLFESQYPVPTGVSYNSYVIRDEKTAILDTVDARATDEWMANVTEALAGEKPAYLVVHHMEPDHGANVARLAALYPEMQVVGNAKTFQYMEQFFGADAIAPERRANPAWAQNTVDGDEINLFDILPLFRLNDGDGGFYLDKACVVSRDPLDPDNFGKQNVGIYRMEVKGKRKLGLQPVPMHDIALHLHKAEERGEDLPIAITLGNDPIITLMGATPLKYDQSEYEMAGALRESPYPIATAPLTGFDVPWGSEVILEGVIESRKREIEGPFGEFTGHYSGGRNMTVVRIDKVSYRSKPIFESLYLGMPWTEIDYLMGPATCVPLYQQLKAEFPEVQAVNAMYTHGLLAIISTKKRYGGFARAVGLRAMTTPHGLGYVKMVIMVDEDVDPFNLPQVMWALSSKVNPAGDLVQLPNMSVLELDPGSSPAGITDKLIIDATTPVAPDNRGHYSQPVVDLPETKAWAEKLTAMLAARK